MDPPREDDITKMAKARVGFKVHAAVYLMVNLFLALTWLLSTGRDTNTATYWPLWTHLGWGLGLAIHGFTVYGPGNNMLAREEEKIRQQLGKT